MDLRSKLARHLSTSSDNAERIALGAQRRPPPSLPIHEPPDPLPTDPKSQRIAELRGMIDRLIAKQRAAYREQPPPSASAPLPSKDARSAGRCHGTFEIYSQTLEPDHCHGKAPLAGALTASTATLAKLALDPAIESIDPARMLFVDTETTGLSSGAGTLAFLIGLGSFTGGCFRLEQLFLASPGDERPMFEAFAERLRAASCIVSFNGKSYDWPLLRTRFVMNRLEPPPLPPHLDLLHPSRRVFKRRLGEVRLVNVETEVLGFRRVHDLAGHEIPDRYWTYLRGGAPRDIDPVLEHNANDIIALAALVGALADQFETVRPRDDPSDHLGLARVALRARDLDRARSFAKAAGDGGGDKPVTIEARLIESRLALKLGEPRLSEACLLDALGAAGDDPTLGSPIRLALAKIYEHHLKDPARALEHAVASAGAEPDETRARRIARLITRIERR